MSFADALAIYWERLNSDASLKPRGKVYREERIAALLIHNKGTNMATAELEPRWFSNKLSYVLFRFARSLTWLLELKIIPEKKSAQTS